MDDIIEILQRRGFIEALTDPALKEQLKTPKVVYCGFDPTNDSLHLGNLVAIVGLRWFQKFGHKPVALIGGATALVGDPSGKNKERPLLGPQDVERNIRGIGKNLKTVLDFSGENGAVVVNNYDWFSSMNVLPFLRDVGKHFRMGPMLSKESVKARLNSEEGMSYTEFSYQLLQAYDFLKLQKEYDVTVQLGGSDQWGNITAGIDLLRRLRSVQGYGITFPLLTNEEGQKLGKSELGATWLSADKLSPYEFYQHLLRTKDADVVKLLRMLTFLDLSEIEQLQSQVDSDPMALQKRLAEEVTRMIHKEEGLTIAQKATEGARPGSQADLTKESLEALSGHIPGIEVARENAVDQPIVDVAAAAGLAASKGAARRLIRSGGLYLNNEQVRDETRKIAAGDLVDGRFLLFASGKKNKILVQIRL